MQVSFETRPVKDNPFLVRDLMTVGVATCTPETPATDVARLMLEKNLEAVVVVEERHAVGVVGEAELVKAFARGTVAQGQDSLAASEIMQEEVPQVPADIPLSAAAQLMLDRGARTAFITHHAGGIEFPTGMISFRHILRFLAANSPEDLRDLGMHAARLSPLEVFNQRRGAARNRSAGKS